MAHMYSAKRHTHLCDRSKRLTSSPRFGPKGPPELPELRPKPGGTESKCVRRIVVYGFISFYNLNHSNKRGGRPLVEVGEVAREVVSRS